MRMLHYSLGFPPYRTGGMTKCCMDLMISQKKEGNQVALMWPGQIKSLDHKVKIKDESNGNKNSDKKSNSDKRGKSETKNSINRDSSVDIEGIQSFEVINPLPISLNGGILDIEKYTKKCPSSEEYERFLDSYRPDIIHLHTLMGLHKEFIEKAKERNIKIIFTTHDYFGICPKVTMFRCGRVCDEAESCAMCVQCNSKALSMRRIKLLQSPIYRKIKDRALMKKARGKFRGKFFYEEETPHTHSHNQKESYIKLRHYYMDILEMTDRIHYNSTLSCQVYESMVPSLSGKGTVIPIAHNDINDHRKQKNIGERISFTYLSPAIESKGYGMLISAMDELWQKGERWFELNLYTGSDEKRPYVANHGRYKYEDLEEIFEGTDALIVPSLWYETFGYVVPEALSYGVPVIMTKNVGAKDLFTGEYGMITEPNKKALEEALQSLKDGEALKKYNKNICDSYRVENQETFASKIYKLYQM